MKVLNAISACAFTFLLLLGSVMGGHVLKCPSQNTFGIIEGKECARKATLENWNESHPLGRDGQKCKANQYSILSPLTRSWNYYLVQVCTTIDNFSLFEWDNPNWVKCEISLREGFAIPRP
ncbi:CSEP0489 putative effector protein [Blumeria hordei DH14]|uniref:CSEP0489 putative effector protein n=1 Tax=Blumeria graminis f. sp. hordei (strain DH14) TaxID=546991 RepID=N1JLS3_BLUG1|nr:CSEP0489 putative effector protein [Blumeria hordei DH14]